MADNVMNPGTENNHDRRRGGNGLIYGILIAALVATWGYLWWDKSKSNQEKGELQTQVVMIDSSKSAVTQQFEAALAQLDMLKSENDSLMRSKSKEVGDLKARIQSILSKRDATEADLREARGLIAQLQSRVDGFKEEIERLKGEKIVLVTQRDSIKRDFDTATAKNVQLSQKIQLGSVLHASDFKLVPINVKNSGKEKVTDKARRADLMRITFVLDENRIADSGRKELYICIIDPGGTPVAVQALGSGRFALSDGTEKLYTTEKTVNYATGEKQTVTIDWKQDADFKPGQYKVEVYEKGFLIGQDSISLRKGGLF